MNPTTPQAEGSTRIGDIDAIRQPSVTRCPAATASVAWAYGMPLSYVQEMASHWLGVYDRMMTLPAPNSREDRPDQDND